jgi:predicted AAA+ superfamily ATPase
MLRCFVDIIRNIDEKLVAWFGGPHRKPLILRGARQVGKTFSVRAFARKHGLQLVEINFEKKPGARKAFEGDLVPAKIIAQLEIIEKEEITAEKTLLFFDEIQDCPRAITALRYFYEETPQLAVIAAGSLLEFVLGTFSFPVGRVQFLQMHPLTFREFLAARGYQKVLPQLPQFPGLQMDVAEPIANLLAEELRNYFVVGGLPEAVSVFLETNSYLAVGGVHDNLITAYLDDIRKYAKGDLQMENARSLLANVFGHVGRQVNYTLFGQGDNVKRTKKSIDLLCQALLVYKVRQGSPSNLPLGASASEKNFKIVFFDIGLGQRMAGKDASEIVGATNALSLFDGQLAEQFVGQELIGESTTACENGHLYYWARNAKSSSAEVDYLLVRNRVASPVEVKAGKSGTLKSLHLYLKEYGGRGIVMQDIHAVQEHGSVFFCPLYTKL